MAARVLLQRRAVATLMLGGVALTPTALFAESPDAARHRRKPIYDDFDITATKALPPPSAATEEPAAPSSSVVSTPLPVTITQDRDHREPHQPHGPSPTDRLAVQIGKARLFLYRHALRAEDAVNRTMDRAFHLEQSFTNTIASLAPPRESGEKLMPGTIYVLVAAMAGSIITRRSNILLRATAPVALGVGTGWTVLPITMGNVGDLAWKYEQRFPVVAENHIKMREGIERGISFAKVHSELGVRYVDEKVTDARETVESWVKKGK
ncbi:hypothetical protein SODALDRAFT_314403 [Sodiomyces alkalinus F11]|uniref:MICOS complex subunit n=1 Tax=Sodiomyces alkalinus (strain CBS 110278 / VKM F-3762 / F11) TaxID=1314773 RepID=A0A3N2PQS1_SODAK|nr:hypothetical protein SODALDRAFT_314403 [Sodiomyces alkalinus F11]ROT36810.1 hypothetical protein SODALDRAFT_314403 [Sodiomyces alkalinus F11]